MPQTLERNSATTLSVASSRERKIGEGNDGFRSNLKATRRVR